MRPVKLMRFSRNSLRLDAAGGVLRKVGRDMNDALGLLLGYILYFSSVTHRSVTVFFFFSLSLLWVSLLCSPVNVGFKGVYPYVGTSD